VRATAERPGAAGSADAPGRLTAALAARDAWSSARLRAHQSRALRAALAHATSASPYYREVLGPDAPARPLEALPTLPKATLVERWDDIVTDPRLRLADLEAHAAGPSAAEPYLGAFRVVSTSGSCGLRGLFVFERSAWETWLALHRRLFGRLGITPATRLVAIGAPGAVHLTRQLFATFRSGREGAPRLSVLTPLDEIVAALNAYQPEALLGYASIGRLLAEEQLAGRLRIRLRVAAFGGETVTDELRERVGAAWGIRPANIYASTEAPIVAASTPAHPDALELTEDALVVEVVDERGRPVPPGVPGFKVLVTTLLNRALPLIRYELSDRVTLAEGGNPAGRPFRCLARIEGRAADTLRLAARGGGEVDLLPYALSAPFAHAPGVRQYQVRWDGARLEVHVVPAPGAAPDTTRLKGALADALRAAGAVPPPIEVRTTERLQREPGPAAKLKLIKGPASAGDALA